MPKTRKLCKWCDEEFKFYIRNDKPDRKFCGNICKFAYQRINPPIRRTGEYRKCLIENCIETFWTEKKENKRFCSHGCASFYKIGKPSGAIYSDETRRKLRLARIKQIEKEKYSGNQMFPSYNPHTIPIIEQYGKENDYKFQHAMNGGEFHIEELGYWVDGYDHQKNVVIEIDEKHHYNANGILKEKDLMRQTEIENFLNCKFIRIKIGD